MEWMTGEQENGALSQMYDYEAVQERLILKPVNFTDNRLELRDCVQIRTGDVALTLCMIMRDYKQEPVAVRVTKAAFEKWERRKTSVFEAALRNTSILAPPRLDFPYLTTAKGKSGAIALFYPEVQRQLARTLDGDFYGMLEGRSRAVIYQSVDFSPRELIEKLSYMNRSLLTKEILSRRIFLYDHRTDKLRALKR